MKFYCPSCDKTVRNKDQEEPLPVKCPECGADLYPEEILYQQMLSETDREVLV